MILNSTHRAILRSLIAGGKVSQVHWIEALELCTAGYIAAVVLSPPVFGYAPAIRVTEAGIEALRQADARRTSM